MGGIKMVEQQKKKCPECGKISIMLWEQVHGMRILTEKEDGVFYYSVKCPVCGWVFEVKR